ncbi:MAG: hypothetical protein ABL962_00820 [Fimbriimonadaceae bacterium]
MRIHGRIGVLLTLVSCASCGGVQGPNGDRYVWISPRGITIQTGRTWQFSADVVGAGSQEVDWLAAIGSIDSDGLYTAPSQAGDDQITAVSRSDRSLYDVVGISVVN